MIKTNKVKLEIHYDHIIRDYDLYKIQPIQTGDKDEEKCVMKRSLEKLDQLNLKNQNAIFVFTIVKIFLIDR